MLTSICWLHMGVRQTPFLILLSYCVENKTQLDEKRSAAAAVCRMSSLPRSELGQKQPVREDAHQDLRDRYDKAKFSHLGRNKGSYG